MTTITMLMMMNDDDVDDDDDDDEDEYGNAEDVMIIIMTTNDAGDDGDCDGDARFSCFRRAPRQLKPWRPSQSFNRKVARSSKSKSRKLQASSALTALCEPLRRPGPSAKA